MKVSVAFAGIVRKRQKCCSAADLKQILRVGRQTGELTAMNLHNRVAERLRTNGAALPAGIAICRRNANRCGSVLLRPNPLHGNRGGRVALPGEEQRVLRLEVLRNSRDHRSRGRGDLDVRISG